MNSHAYKISMHNTMYLRIIIINNREFERNENLLTTIQKVIKVFKITEVKIMLCF